MMHALLALAVAASAPPDSLLSADSLLAEMRKGGYTMIWRHAATDRTVQEPMANYQTTPRFQQRNLTDRGIADAKLVGTIFKAHQVPIGDVITSPMFRTRETAEYAFGRVTSDTWMLRVVDPNPDQKKLLAAQPGAGTNRVIVTHHFVIERNVAGVKPGMVDEGEAAVVRRVSDDSVKLVGIFKMADWQRLGARLAAANAAAAGNVPPAKPAATAHSPLTIPAVLHTTERAAIVEYITTFNAGDDARMRRFYDTRVVPNPDRTMEQRMEVFQRLKGQLGTLSIDSASVGEGGRVEVKTTSSAGPRATLVFTMEPATPHRLVGISFQIGGGGHP